MNVSSKFAINFAVVAVFVVAVVIVVVVVAVVHTSCMFIFEVFKLQVEYTPSLFPASIICTFNAVVFNHFRTCTVKKQ
jgi:hypothetical protein